MHKRESAIAVLTRTVDAKLKSLIPARRRTTAIMKSSDRPMIDPSSAPSATRTQPRSGTPQRGQSLRQATMALEILAGTACTPQERIRALRARNAPAPAKAASSPALPTFPAWLVVQPKSRLFPAVAGSPCANLILTAAAPAARWPDSRIS